MQCGLHPCKWGFPSTHLDGSIAVRCLSSVKQQRPQQHVAMPPSLQPPAQRSAVRVHASSEEVGPRKHKRGGGKASASLDGLENRGSVAGLPPKPEEFMDEGGEEEESYLAPYMDAVVKVYCIHTEPNYSMPWQRKRQYNSTSTGFIVKDGNSRWLLSNAHSVDYGTQVKVKKRGDDRKFLARVLSIGVDCDIALLTVDDEAFWDETAPLQFGPLPKLQDSVAVVGYPIGGDTISVTAGVVSRIEVTDYSHGSMDLLAIQIDAAINGGNSGGPVFNKHCECVGIAFQALVGEDVENVGYVIPTPVVQHFLTDFKKTGTFSGFPALGLQWQRMESDALRRAYHMSPQHKGVLVRNINPTSQAFTVIQPDDIILRFDGITISNDGTVPFRTGERIKFSYLVTQKFVGDSCAIDLLRGGKVVSVTVSLSKPTPLVPPHIGNRDPSYLVVGGLVFTVCIEPYLQSEYGNEYGTESPVKLLDRLYYGMPKGHGEEVVVLSQVLASEATLGYEDVYNVQLLRFNGVEVINLKQLAQLVHDCEEQYMRFDLEYNEVVVIETAAVQASTPDVLGAHSIPHPSSNDLRQALPAPATASAQAAESNGSALPAPASTSV